MQITEYKIPFPAVDLKQALSDIIESIAIEGTAVGHLLAAESDLLEKAKKSSDHVDEFTDFNASVNSIVRNIAALQLFTHYELEDSENLLQKTMDFIDCEDMEE